MKKYLILFAGCTLLMAACSDFLELDESVYQTTKYQFSTFDRVKQSATNVYSYVQEGLLDVEGTMIDAATDDAVYAWSTAVQRFTTELERNEPDRRPLGFALFGYCRGQLFPRQLPG